MGALLGLTFGIGLALVHAAFTRPPLHHAVRDPQAGVRRRLAEAGMGQVSPASVVVLCGVLGLVAGLAVHLLTGTWPIALAFAVMAAWAPVALIKARGARRLREFAEVWPDAVDNLASGVRAGLSLPEAVAELAQSGPEPLRDSFASFALDHQLTGRFGESLDRLKERLADPVGDRVVEGLRVAREVGGGDLGRVLRNLSRFLRDDLHTRSELESRQSWVVNGARLAVAAPWAVLLLMGSQGSTLHRYSSPVGVVVLGCGAAACVGAYRMMVRIGRLPSQRRVLG